MMVAELPDTRVTHDCDRLVSEHAGGWGEVRDAGGVRLNSRGCPPTALIGKSPTHPPPDPDRTFARWARLGVFLGVAPARRSPELERLLLDTARLAPGRARLFLSAVRVAEPVRQLRGAGGRTSPA